MQEALVQCLSETLSQCLGLTGHTVSMRQLDRWTAKYAAMSQATPSLLPSPLPQHLN